MALAQDLLERRAAFCIGHQPLQIRPAHLLKAEMGSTSRELVPAARFPEAHCGALMQRCDFVAAVLSAPSGLEG
jgi:hypothetical protein